MVIEIKTDKPYEVIVEDGVLDRAGEKIAPLVRPGSRAMIVSETNVFPIYGERLKASLDNEQFRIFDLISRCPGG